MQTTSQSKEMMRDNHEQAARKISEGFWFLLGARQHAHNKLGHSVFCAKLRIYIVSCTVACCMCLRVFVRVCASKMASVQKSICAELLGDFVQYPFKVSLSLSALLRSNGCLDDLKRRLKHIKPQENLFSKAPHESLQASFYRKLQSSAEPCDNLQTVFEHCVQDIRPTSRGFQKVIRVP